MHTPDRKEILDWLKTEDPERIDRLWRTADRTRRENTGESVHLRALVELSNRCARNCLYCGIRVANTGVERYRMDADEVLDCARKAKKFGYGTIVIQAGEDFGIKADWLAGIIREIKKETGLAVTLSMGERTDDELRLWKDADANRYLLRFETSDRELFDRIHPPAPGGGGRDRVEILETLRAMGYETGSGVMVGIPGQTYESLANDITLFARLDLDMIGLGPYIAHPDTPLARDPGPAAGAEQVPATALMACKTLALARLVCPQANIPSTTALATIDAVDGRRLGLERGANVIMPNLTPARYRRLYEIYPDKASSREESEETNRKAMAMLEAMGRPPGTGPGDRRKTRS